MFLALRRDERGLIFAQIAALVAGPIVALTIAMAAITVMRTGAGLTESLSRDTTATSLVADFKRTVGQATVLESRTDGSIVVSADPLKYKPGSAVSEFATLPTVCLTTKWQFVKEGSLYSLVRTIHYRSNSNCTSTIVDTVTTKLTGFSSGKINAFNKASRPGTVAVKDELTLASETRPDGVAPADWNDTRPAAYRLDAVMQQPIGTRVLTSIALAPSGLY
ncbi:hypothetical protein [Microbacterium sp. 77mftsu3.1]|uniref:hypothetical protein n=1 Tax=Microbacterium sp. 77mftsu3.1 TaxID=1761802 RepID=UPI00036EB205|nr:hypothetical protein [Microbacterium sp. 77mftsu3.1]SDH51169.1 hypothetical protein SAMN04488590_3486 [Microbacterium sp. 77mftsu3.1]